ncbi:hypothetical protein QE152_g27445 [Popillia japonica]|uniref:Uncharacterized protein n=1 Tax=Popillia japonica TaxID=7064 RepID=A0AAW1JSH9_POPJA
MACTIGIIPKGGYRWRDNQSIIATQWLIWEKKQRGINIQNAAKGQEAGQEAVICGVKVDGFCGETGQFEFHGCFWHGCPRCIVVQRNEPCHNDPSTTMAGVHAVLWYSVTSLVTTTHLPQWSGATKTPALKQNVYGKPAMK